MIMKRSFNLNREKKFDIDDENLEGKYKDWQKKLHPDLVHSKSKVIVGEFWSFMRKWGFSI